MEYTAKRPSLFLTVHVYTGQRQGYSSMYSRLIIVARIGIGGAWTVCSVLSNMFTIATEFQSQFLLMGLPPPI